MGGQGAGIAALGDGYGLAAAHAIDAVVGQVHEPAHAGRAGGIQPAGGIAEKLRRVGAFVVAAQVNQRVHGFAMQAVIDVGQGDPVALRDNIPSPGRQQRRQIGYREGFRCGVPVEAVGGHPAHGPAQGTGVESDESAIGQRGFQVAQQLGSAR